MVKLKFRCHYKETFYAGTEREHCAIKMSPVYGGSPENEEFYKYTPGGDICFSTVNTAAAAQIDQGKEYYIDIVPVETDTCKMQTNAEVLAETAAILKEQDADPKTIECVEKIADFVKSVES